MTVHADGPAAPAPGQPDERDPEPIPLSALQHAVFCLRQAALIHLERLWAENLFTAEGHVLHIAADKAGSRKSRGVRRVMAMPIASRIHGIAGVADMVEFHAGDGTETAYPVEYKRGKPKSHHADEAQLCAQALCLEEMTGHPVPEGALYYAQTKRRIAVRFDEPLRRLTLDTVAGLRTVFASLRTPPAVYRADRCRACSLIALCRPKAAAKSVSAWRERTLWTMLADDAP
jgi:CRISPR-associated exonuclease Cas4